MVGRRVGHIVTIETRKKISDTLKGRKLSEERKKKISETLKKKGLRPPLHNHPHREETKRKISETRKRLGLKPDKKYHFKKGHIPWITGKKHTEETKNKMRVSRLGQVLPTKDSSIEVALQNELNRREIKYQKHVPICGVCQPDIVFPLRNIAIFADGNYWHSKEFRNGDVWNRDRYQERELREKGWTVLRFWGHEIKDDVSGCVDQIIEVL